MSDHDLPSILAQAERQASELAVKASADQTHGEAEVSLQTGGETWALKWWAKAKAVWGGKPEASTGVEYTRRWFGGWCLLIACLSTGCASAWQRTALETPSHEAMYVPPTTATMTQPLAELRSRVEAMQVTILDLPPGTNYWGVAGPDESGQRVIALSAELGVDARFEVLAHEAAHLLQPGGLSEAEREVFAERVMVAVCAFYGHDATDVSARYLGRYKTGFAGQTVLDVDYRRAVRILTGREAM